MTFTAKDIRDMVQKLKSAQIPHKTLATQKEVDDANTVEQCLFGDRAKKWEIGDTYYNLKDFMS